MAADRVHRAATAVAAWVRRGSRGDAVPLGDTHDLERPARRTRLVRLGLAVALVAALLAAVASIPGPHGRRFLPADTVAMVVLDLSSSIRPTTYKLIGFELASLAKTDQRVGVVVFSDVAYTALPPGTPASELAPFARFYTDDRIHYGPTARLCRATPGRSGSRPGRASRPACGSPPSCSDRRAPSGEASSC